MKTRIIIYLTATILLHMTVQQAFGQKALDQKRLRELFPEKKVIAEAKIKDMTLRRRNFNATKRYVSFFGFIDNKHPLSEVYLYDIEGNLLWQKQVNTIVSNIVMSDESDKVVVLYHIDQYHAFGINACFDRSGNKLWELRVPVPGITAMSSDGKYGITRVASEENGKFRLFDLELGIELETNIPQGSRGFRAQFIDSEHVVVLIQNVDVTRDEKALKRLTEMISKKGFNRRKGIPNTWIETWHPAMIIVYHIPTQTIVTQRKLYSFDGEPLYVAMADRNYISISNDQEKIALALRKKGNIVVAQVNLQGDIEWEVSNVPKSKIKGVSPYINGLYDLGNGTLLISEDGPMYHLVDRTNGETLWQVPVEGKESIFIRQIFLQDKKLVLHTSHYGWNSKVHTLDITSGVLLKDSEDFGEIIMFNNQAGAMIYNHSQRQLQFLK